MEDSKKDVLKRENFNIGMPSKIRLGDPIYFKNYGDEFKYVYSKSFRGKKCWVGNLEVTEEIDSDINNLYRLKEVNTFITFAPNEELLKLYKERSYKSNQRVVEVEIGVDTARYMLEVGNRYIEVNTGSDGLMGTVYQLFNKSKLEGIVIDLTGLDVNDYERFRDELKYVFNS